MLMGYLNVNGISENLSKGRNISCLRIEYVLFPPILDLCIVFLEALFMRLEAIFLHFEFHADIN